jgi:RNA polymerase sigma-70 factor (ECF subfamily)
MVDGIYECPSISRDEVNCLIDHAASGCRQAYLKLFQLHEPRLTRYVARLIPDLCQTEDVVQDVFIAGMTKISDHHRGVPLENWLVSIARNRSYTALRDFVKRKATSFSSGEGFEECASHIDSPEAEGIWIEEMAEVRDAIANLPEKFRVVITLRYYEEMSYEQIAETLEIPVGTVKSRLFTAHVELKQTLEEVV